MRRLLLLLFSTCVFTLNGVITVSSVLSNYTDYAAFSETRAITAYHDLDDEGTSLDFLTLWDITNPDNPLQGVTMSEPDWLGYNSYTNPTLYHNLLVYSDELHIHIVDITDIFQPVNAGQLSIQAVYCFTLYEHYLILGKQDGSLVTYDFNDPGNLQWMSMTASMPAIWGIWQCGDRLAVSCGMAATNTVKLFEFTPNGALIECTSVPTTGRVDYIGIMNGNLLIQLLTQRILLYDVTDQSNPLLLLDTPPNQVMHNIRTDGEKAVSLSSQNCLTVWELNEENQWTSPAYYNLAYLNAEEGGMFALRDNLALVAVGSTRGVIFDISDLSLPVGFVSQFSNGTYINKLVNPESGNYLFCNSTNGLGVLSFNPDYTLSEAFDFTDWGTLRCMEFRSGKLYTIMRDVAGTSLKCIDVSNPQSPFVYSTLPALTNEYLTVKGDKLYKMSGYSISKYSLNAAGIPLWQADLTYQINMGSLYDVYFYDIVSHNGDEYAIGDIGGFFEGYLPVLICWHANGETEYQVLDDFVHGAYARDGYLFLVGKGVYVYRLDNNGTPELLTTVSFASPFSSSLSRMLYHDRYLLVSNSFTNDICIYDLVNPLCPVLIDCIQQAEPTYSMAVCGDKLLAANGAFGIKVFDLAGIVANQDAEITPVTGLQAYPNPFSGQINIKFELDSATPAKVSYYNSKGQLVRTQSLQNLKSGENITTWDGRDNTGKDCAAGIYLVKLQTVRHNLSRKIIKLN